MSSQNLFSDLEVPFVPLSELNTDYDVDEGWFDRHLPSPTSSRTANGTFVKPSAKIMMETDQNEEGSIASASSKTRRDSAMRVVYTHRWRTKNPIMTATVPKTPHLRCLNRRRPLYIDTPRTREDKELELMKQQQFKATKLDQGVFAVPKVKELPHKHTTAQGPILRTTTRAMNRAVEETESNPVVSHFFKANPVPDYDALRKQGVHYHSPIEPTLPKTPAFSKRRRFLTTSMRHSEEAAQKEVVKFYHPAPVFGSPFRPHHNKKATKAEPFSFENRPPIGKTKLKTEGGEKGVDQNNSTTNISKFRARPAPKADPFKPIHNLIPPTKPRESLVPHAVDSRLVERRAFDKNFSERWSTMERMRDERVNAMTQHEIEANRKKAEFKARPIKQYRRLSVRLAHKSTKANSPKFSERLNCVDQRVANALKAAATYNKNVTKK